MTNFTIIAPMRQEQFHIIERSFITYTNMTSNSSSTNTVQAVERALDLLDLLSESINGASLSNLSEGAQLNKSTTHRLLSTLSKKGYARQDSESKRYYLGHKSLSLHQAAQSQFELRNLAMDQLQEIAKRSNELANLAILSDFSVVYIAQAYAEHRSVGMFTKTGAQVPPHCTGVGKAMLAYMQPNDIDTYFNTQTLNTYTINTITNELQLKNQLEEIRHKGYAEDNEEREIGVRCIAAPIFRAGGKVVGAISISAPPARLKPTQDEEVSKLVKNAAEKISKKLGFTSSLD